MNGMSRKLDRRTVLAAGAVGLGGILLPAGLAVQARPSSQASVTSHAALGHAAHVGELPAPASQAAAVEIALAPTETAVAVDAATLPFSYEGVFPGPLIRLHEGDRVRLTFANRLDRITNLHLHGLHIPPSVDDPFVHVMPGESRLYEFTVSAGSAGTYWYHPHHHGELAAQIRGGLVGPLLITGPPDDVPELQAAQDELLVLTSLGGRGRGGGQLLVNGRRQQTVTVTRPTVRLRLLNASADDFLRLAFEDLMMHLIATDGGFIDSPVSQDALLLAPGERAEVLVQLSDPGSHQLIGTVISGFARGGGAGGPALPLMTLDVPTAMVPLPLPQQLTQVESLDPDQAVTTRHVILDSGLRIDGHRFDEDRVDIRSRVGSLEIWDVENASGQRHAFHLHTYSFQVLARNDIPEPFVAWKDVVALPPGDRVRLAIPFADFGGKTVLHCHVARHNDRGMMAVLDVVEPTS
jgi:FtsP/CotA-like multicopper oxidase with cupredoxin domain